jgi:hypothetical protein
MRRAIAIKSRPRPPTFFSATGLERGTAAHGLEDRGFFGDKLRAIAVACCDENLVTYCDGEGSVPSTSPSTSVAPWASRRVSGLV